MTRRARSATVSLPIPVAVTMSRTRGGLYGATASSGLSVCHRSRSIAASCTRCSGRCSQACVLAMRPSASGAASKAGRDRVGIVSRRRRSRSTPDMSGARACSAVNAENSRISRSRLGRGGAEICIAFGQVLAGRRHHREDRRRGQRRAGEQFGDFDFCPIFPVDRSQVAFSQRHGPAPMIMEHLSKTIRDDG